MQIRHRSTDVISRLSGGLSVPLLAKAGAVVITIGLLFDLAEHTVLHAAHDELLGAFPLGEHFAHLTVVIGMALVLAGIVADGIASNRRRARQEGTLRHAIR